MGTMMRPHIGVCLSLAILGACCPENPIQPHWGRVMKGYDLVVDRVSKRPIANSDRTSVDLDHRSWRNDGYIDDPPTMRFGMADASGLQVWFRNETDVPVFIEWSRIHYVDENGIEHDTEHRDYGVSFARNSSPRSSSRDEIAPGSGRWKFVKPTEKSYEVRYGFLCGNSTIYSEPLVPWDLGDRTEPAMDAHIAGLHQRGAVVRWRIPVSYGTVSYTYIVTHRLRSAEERRSEQLWEDDFISEHGRYPEFVKQGPP